MPRRSTLLISFLACFLLDVASQVCRCLQPVQRQSGVDRELDIRAVVPEAAEHRRAAHCADWCEAGGVIPVEPKAGVSHSQEVSSPYPCSLS